MLVLFAIFKKLVAIVNLSMKTASSIVIFISDDEKIFIMQVVSHYTNSTTIYKGVVELRTRMNK